MTLTDSHIGEMKTLTKHIRSLPSILLKPHRSQVFKILLYLNEKNLTKSDYIYVPDDDDHVISVLTHYDKPNTN